MNDQVKTGLETVSLESAAEQLKDKIRSAFVDIIPPEQWKAMVENELKAFTQTRPGAYNHSDRRPSVFSEICSSVYSDFIRDQVRRRSMIRLSALLPGTVKSRSSSRSG